MSCLFGSKNIYNEIVYFNTANLRRIRNYRFSELYLRPFIKLLIFLKGINFIYKGFF
jgi:hypothetical protein